MTQIVTIDFETYYDAEYSLSKLTTEEYIRDPRFEALLVGIKVDAEPTYTVCGGDIGPALDKLRLDTCAVLAHHAQFDGLILSHHFGIRPKIWFDTLSMARPILGLEVGGSLAKLATHFQLPPKGTNVLQMKGLRLKDMSPRQLREYEAYCAHDVDLTREIFDRLRPHFQKSELKLIDLTIRLFTEPVLEIDHLMLDSYAKGLRAEKLCSLLQAGVTVEEVMSNVKFAAALRRLNVNPPMKMSPTTGAMTFAFAKTDPGLAELAEHPNEQVQVLIAARLGNKSTINETRAERMIAMAQRGAAPIYLKYYGAAQTGRMSGGDKMNWQNLSRGSTLRRAIKAPAGHMLVVCDSSNIESRVLDWLAEHDDAMEIYRAADAKRGPDAYCTLASNIYNRPITEDNPAERQVGKIAKLGLGYQMGASKFQFTALTFGVKLSGQEALKIVNIYRQTHEPVVALWNKAQRALVACSERAANDDSERYVDARGIVRIDREHLWLPNGMAIRYPRLQPTSVKGDFEYSNGRTMEKIYGGKVVENIVQALARIIVMAQTLEIAKRYRVVMSVHDETVVCVPEEQAEEAAAFMKQAMSTPLSWCLSLPLAAKVGVSQSYGEAK